MMPKLKQYTCPEQMRRKCNICNFTSVSDNVQMSSAIAHFHWLEVGLQQLHKGTISRLWCLDRDVTIFYLIIIMPEAINRIYDGEISIIRHTIAVSI